MMEENIESVKVLVEGDQSLSIAEIAPQTGLNTTMVWKILRKKLKLYALKPHEVIPRSVENMEVRVDFCTWLLALAELESRILSFSSSFCFLMRRSLWSIPIIRMSVTGPCLIPWSWRKTKSREESLRCAGLD